MDWLTIRDIFRKKQCHTRTSTGTCDHRGCRYTAEMIAACESYHHGTPTNVSVDEIRTHLETKRCRDICCSHKACRWVDEQLSTFTYKRAA